MIHERDRVPRRMTLIDPERPNAGGVVNRRVLVAEDPPARSLKCQELHVDLHVMARHLFFVAVCMDCATAHPVREAS